MPKTQQLIALVREVRDDINKANNYWLHNLQQWLESDKPPTPAEALEMVKEARLILGNLAE